MEERFENCISDKIEVKIVQLAGAMPKTLHESLKGTVIEPLQKVLYQKPLIRVKTLLKMYRRREEK